MEDPRAPKRAALNYAAMSLVVRLIASQTGVFSLWYGRRAYERSRGEIITMLYEKTLSRKVVSATSQAIVEPNAEDITKGLSKDDETSPLEGVLNYLLKPLSFCYSRRSKSPKENRKHATMGKILNLMRYVFEYAI